MTYKTRHKSIKRRSSRCICLR